MKKIIILLLVLLTNLANASNWVLVSTTTDSSSTFFVDTQSMMINGNSVTYWVRVNLNKRDEYGNLSYKAQQTINCRTKEFLDNFHMYYEDLNNSGKLLKSFKGDNKWLPIPPDTSMENIKVFVCRR